MANTKSTTSITIDYDLKEMIRVKKIEDSDFNFSNLINEFLRDLFKEEVKDLDLRKIKADKLQLKRQLALIEIQEKAIFDEEKKQKKKDFENITGKKSVSIEPFVPRD